MSELTQRTNKCTNGTRYTLGQLKEKVAEEDYDLYTVCLFDKFSDLGVVGVMGINNQHMDLFSLSCRALGRDVENKMINWLLERKIDSSRFVSTGKNEHLCDLLKAYGGSMAAETEC